MNGEHRETAVDVFRSRSFLGLSVTQFLGAFNDNLFKELVLLFCLDQARLPGGTDLQGLATILFSAPFILLSGFAGFLADRFSKRIIIVGCKLAEVAICGLGVLAFLTGRLDFLLAVLCIMGAHSAIFGPPKYGILPELFRPVDLPKVNSGILMLTFLAIIFGMSAAGLLKSLFESNLWVASLGSLLIAVLGVMTALGIAATPVADPGLKFQWSSCFAPPDTRAALWKNRELFRALVAYSVFWLAGGMVYPNAVNELGKNHLHFADWQTGLLAATTGAGIAAGCVVAGVLSRKRIVGGLVTTGAAGVCAMLVLLAIPTQNGTLLGVWGAVVALLILGLCAGLFSVPLQVFLQSQAPVDQKGRIIGLMNLFNWIGIASSGLVYWISSVGLKSFGFSTTWTFAAAAVVLLPVALFYKPPSVDLGSGAVASAGPAD